MGKRFYRGACAFFRFITPKMKHEWAVPFDGEPCVFIGNHAGAWGPIDLAARFEMRDSCYYWLNHDVMEEKLVPAYVRQDYWWKPGCKLEPFYNATLPYLAAAILPPVLRSAPGVPVYHDMRVMTTLRQSLRHLDEGKNLVIFPEQPSGYGSHHTWINTGFLQVAAMYAKRTSKGLKFWPLHLDHKNSLIRIAPPVVYDPERSLDEQRQEIADRLAAGLRGEW